VQERVRVVEYSVASSEEREVMAREMAQELEAGARVLGMVPIVFDSLDGAMQTVRVAVFYGDLGDVEPVGELVATATIESTVVEQIEHMTEDYQRKEKG
jgi:hypothetical protein